MVLVHVWAEFVSFYLETHINFIHLLLFDWGDKVCDKVQDT